MSNRNRSNWTRIRICCDCGREQIVRKDNLALRCISCAARKSGAKGNATRKARRLQTQCDCCLTSFFTTRSALNKSKNHYCSKACHYAAHQVQRTCRQCQKVFRLARSVVEGTSNSSGNYCSRECYEESLCKPDDLQPRGSRWKSIREDVLRKIRLCAYCGKTGQLEVHHIVPYRITADNHHSNLITLCKSCHYKVETQTKAVEKSGVDPVVLKLFFRTLLVEKLMVNLAMARARK